MNRKLGMIIVGGLIAGLSLFVVGCEMCCNSSQGSGSMVITDPTTKGIHKATFSYRVECVGSYEDPATNPAAVRKISGRLEYQDHRAWTNEKGTVYSVSIHGAVNDVLDTEIVVAAPDYPGDITRDDYCSVLKPNVAMFKGVYRPQPKSIGDGGEFTVIVEDNGKPGPSAEDKFEIELTSGVFKGYKQSGVLAGGNVKAL